MQTNLEDRIRAHLADQASGLQPEGAGFEAAMHDGRRLQRSRRILTSVAAVAFVVLGVAGAFAVRSALASDPVDDQQIASPGEASSDPIAAVPGAVGAPLAAMDWYAVESTLGYTTRIVASDDGAIYALSTAPGVTWENAAGGSLPRALYKTQDGEAWTVALLEGDIGFSDIAERKGTLYTIGTAPGFQGIDGGSADYRVGTSTDGGETWETAALPTEAAPPEDLGQVNWVEASAHIAAGPEGVVALTSTRFHVDLVGLLPNDLGGEFMDVQPTDTGIQALDYSIFEELDMQCSQEMEALGGDTGEIPEEEMPEPCRKLFSGTPEEAVVFTATWEELGFAGGNPLMFSELFVSSDGETYEPVASPFAADEWMRGLYHVDGGFVGVTSGLNEPRVRFSEDGRSWVEVEGLPSLGDVMSVGSYAGRLVVVGMGFAGKPIVATAEVGGGEWTQADLSEVFGDARQDSWISAAAVGEQGVVLAHQSWDAFTEQSVIELVRGNGIDQWERVPILDVLGAEDGWVEWLAVGGDHVVGRVMVGSRFGPPTAAQIVGAVAD